MSAPFRDLTYGLEGYNDRAASKLLVRRYLPFAFRYAQQVYVVFVALFALALFVGPEVGVCLSSGQVLVFACVGASLGVIAMLKRYGLISEGLKRSAFRSGTISLSQSDDGLTFSNVGSQISVRWSHIVDVIPGKDGLLVLTSPVQGIPIPAAAFADAGEQDLFLKELRARVAGAKGAAQ